MEFVKLIPINRICPCCGNGNYMRIISGKYVGELNVKCINCNSYYNYDELLKRDNSKPLDGADGRTMADLISRAAALDALDHERKVLIEQERFGAEHIVVHHARRLIEDLPAVEAAPVVHARWIHHEGGFNDHFECKACGMAIVLTGKWNYCPNCGALMGGKWRESE